MNNPNSIAAESSAKRLQIKEITLLIAASLFLTFIIHLIPPLNGLRLGAILLPMFYVPLIAVTFYKFHTALAVTALGPVLNYLLTGSPKLGSVPLLTSEVLLFVLILTIIHKYDKLKKAGALISVLPALVFAPLAFGIFNSPGFDIQHILFSLRNAVPGIIVLTVLNIFLLRLRDKL